MLRNYKCLLFWAYILKPRNFVNKTHVVLEIVLGLYGMLRKNDEFQSLKNKIIRKI